MAEQTTAVYDDQKAIRDGNPVGDRKSNPGAGDGRVNVRVMAAHAEISGRAFAANDRLRALLLPRTDLMPVGLFVRHGAGGGSATMRDVFGGFVTGSGDSWSTVAAGDEVRAPRLHTYGALRVMSFLFPAANAAALAPKITVLFGAPGGEDG